METAPTVLREEAKEETVSVAPHEKRKVQSALPKKQRQLAKAAKKQQEKVNNQPSKEESKAMAEQPKEELDVVLETPKKEPMDTSGNLESHQTAVTRAATAAVEAVKSMVGAVGSVQEANQDPEGAKAEQGALNKTVEIVPPTPVAVANQSFGDKGSKRELKKAGNKATLKPEDACHGQGQGGKSGKGKRHRSRSGRRNKGKKGMERHPRRMRPLHH